MTLNLRRDGEDDKAYAWPYRAAAVEELIIGHEPQILCTQEGYAEMLNRLNSRFPEYSRVGTGRMADGSDEHVAIFFDRARFELAEQGQFWLSEEPDVPGSKAWGTVFPRICTWCVLSERRGATQLGVFNVHLDNRRLEARLAAPLIIGERMMQVRGRLGKDLPIVLCGDFNAFPDSREVRTLCGEEAEIGVILKGCDDITTGTFHGFSGKADHSPIDYVLTTPEVSVVQRFVDNRQYQSIWPSDHFPIVADLHIH
jgi:endonuclease/exonuclease/phosphatase family metal-dependent hydrolase